MIEMEQLHRHSPTAPAPHSTSKLNAVMNPLSLTNYGTVPDNYSLSSGSSSALENNSLSRKLKSVNQSHSTCNSSSVGGTSSSAASSIDFFCFPPTKEEGGEEEKTQTPDQGISLTTSSTKSDPESLSRPTTTTSTATVTIDDLFLSMLNTAQELSKFSANDCSRSIMSKSLQTSSFEKIDHRQQHHPHPQPQCTNNTLALKNCDKIVEEKESSPSPNLSKEAADELSSEVESLIKELDAAASTRCNRPQGGTPKFSPMMMDDPYTTNSYVSFVRGLAQKQAKKRNKDDVLNRTTSWAANLATNPPPLPVTTVPSTPVMSKYRIMNSSMKISPDYSERNDTPTSTKSTGTKSTDLDGYFFHNEDSFHSMGNNVHNKFSNFATKLVHGTRLAPMHSTMNHPSSNNSEASLSRSSQRQTPRFGGALVMRNAAFYANTTFPLNHRQFDNVNFLNRGVPNPVPVTRIDQLLDYESEYLYGIQPADKLQIIRSLALEEMSGYIERSVSFKIKQWGMNLDFFQIIRNKFSRHRPPQQIIKDKLFGMPLHYVQAQNGNCCPFPRFIMDIMEYLKESAINIDGIFRRSGSKTRIEEMREICDTLTCYDPLPEELKTLNQVHDLSDLLKQYLRAIPQRLVPREAAETAACAISASHPDKHLDIIKLMTIVMPDEHRDALLIFVDFLLSISKNAVQNLMTVENLAVCVLPTVFDLNINSTSKKLTPVVRRKTIDITFNKELLHYRAMKDGLSDLISYRSEFDTIPPHILKAANQKPLPQKKKRDLKDAMPGIEEIGAASSLRCFVANLFKEYEQDWKSWHIELIYDNGIVFATREVDDSCAIKSCRLELPVLASPQYVVSTLINHREKWDLITSSTKPTFIDASNKEDIAHITFNNFNDALTRKATVARVWEDYEPGTGRAFVAEKSCKKDPFCVNVKIYHSAFIICPSNGKSIINYVNRIDLKGKSVEWYEKTYRQLLISQMSHLAYLFKNLSA